MSFLKSKVSKALSEAENDNTNNNSTEEQEMLSGIRVTSHVYLKPAHSSETLNKDVVLRRIRQRKRANKVRAVVQGFFGLADDSSKLGDDREKVSVRWVDDAFAAP